MEFILIRFLKYQANQKETPSFHKLIENAPSSAAFAPYQTVSDCHFNLPDGHHRQFDILAKATDETQASLLIECKYHKNPISPKLVKEFALKYEEVKKEFSLLIPILYSVSGFTKSAIDQMKEDNIAWSHLKLWNILEKKGS